MSPGVYPLTLYQGDTYRWQFGLWLDAEKTRPADLKGAVAQATIAGGKQHLDLETEIILPNFVRVNIPHRMSMNLPAQGLWQLQLIRGDEVQTIVRGPVSVMACVA